MIKIRYQMDCHCDATMETVVLDMSNPIDDGSVVIDLGMAAEQITMTCDDCGCTTYTGDLTTEVEPDECPGRDEDEEDEDEEDEDEVTETP